MFNIFIEVLQLLISSGMKPEEALGHPPCPMKNIFKGCYLRANENGSPRSLADKTGPAPPKVFTFILLVWRITNNGL